MTGSLDRRTGFVAAVVIGGFALGLAALLLVDAAGGSPGSSSAEVAKAPQPTPQLATPSPSLNNEPSMVVDGSAPAEEWHSFTSAEAGFAIDLPTDWVEEPDNDPQVAWVHGRGGALRIRVGSESGNILICDVPASEPCKEVTIESVETLVELLVPTGLHSPPFVPGSVWVSRKATSLGAIPAVQMTVRAWETGPSGAYTRHYVVAVDGGRPVIIQWQPGTFKGHEFHHLIDTFRFLD